MCHRRCATDSARVEADEVVIVAEHFRQFFSETVDQAEARASGTTCQRIQLNGPSGGEESGLPGFNMMLPCFGNFVALTLPMKMVAVPSLRLK